MKPNLLKQIPLILLFTIIAGCSQELNFHGILTVYPENPQPGNEITVLYNADSTNLSGEESIEMIVYLFNTDVDTTFSIDMNKDRQGWQAKFRSSEDHAGALLKFRTADKKKLDNNNRNGYFVNFNSQSGSILPEAIAGQAVAVSSWGAFYAELDRDRDKALALFDSSFKMKPDIKRNFVSPYLMTLLGLYPNSRDSIYKSIAESTELNSDLSEDELNILLTYYSMSEYYDSTKFNQYRNIIEEIYPKGNYIQNDHLSKIRFEQNIETKIEQIKEFEEKFPDSKNIPSAYDQAALALRDAKNYRGAFEFLLQNKDKVSPYRFYSVVLKMLEQNADMNLALRIAELGVERNRQELKTPTLPQKNYESFDDAESARKDMLAITLTGYGRVLTKLEKQSDALNAFEEAVNLTDSKYSEFNELYIGSLMNNEEYETAKAEIEKFIDANTHTPLMKEDLKEAFIKINGSEEGFDEYISHYEDTAKENLIEKLKAEIIERPAPEFILYDLNGNRVSSNDYKGKTVVVDFWATWCGPCIMSFPGMQQAVDKYSGNDDVKFLFINSWERVDNKKQNAEDFIKKNNYSFHVLMDEENKVITDFKVSGIPTKFIIDKNGNIRFISIGYEGTPESMVEEISAMIEMVM